MLYLQLSCAGVPLVLLAGLFRFVVPNLFLLLRVFLAARAALLSALATNKTLKTLDLFGQCDLGGAGGAAGAALALALPRNTTLRRLELDCSTGFGGGGGAAALFAALCAGAEVRGDSGRGRDVRLYIPAIDAAGAAALGDALGSGGGRMTALMICNSSPGSEEAGARLCVEVSRGLREGGSGAPLRKLSLEQCSIPPANVKMSVCCAAPSSVFEASCFHAAGHTFSAVRSCRPQGPRHSRTLCGSHLAPSSFSLSKKTPSATPEARRGASLVASFCYALPASRSVALILPMLYLLLCVLRTRFSYSLLPCSHYWPIPTNLAPAGIALALALIENAAHSRLRRLHLGSCGLGDAAAAAFGATLAAQGMASLGRARAADEDKDSGGLGFLILDNNNSIGRAGVVALAGGIRQAGAWFRGVSLFQRLCVVEDSPSAGLFREAAEAWRKRHRSSGGRELRALPDLI